ncbi:NAD(P)/FAD-dependent oxidoreductase [Baekduia soli]|uniref:NAD(P)/FAD-dependent oxidoreductase n=1 Tax=Baekduia soli TaxID=496014 RepID=A0A5B8U485_9ACTN|nr:FAD/NAD(P)-binding oxidoreductase [Baekduia soli]QEC47919.1 NAD(P)/FAD-dependent oxidoreductase [Baekduia soli]
MSRRIVILGGGTGGTLAANRLRRVCGADVEIIVVDRDDRHVYQPGLLFVPFGLAEPEEIVRSRRAQLHDGVDFRLAEVEHVDAPASTVHLAGGETIAYDVLVVASGAALLPEETEGLGGAGWGQEVFTFFELESATALAAALAELDRGRLVVNPVDMPIKCPVAPLEFCFLADWYLRERGVRDAVQITYVTSLDAAFTKPVASAHLAGLLAAKGIALETEFATGQVDGAQGRLVSYDDREVPFDLLVSIPLHGGPAHVGRSPGLGDELGFVATDPHTLQARVAPNVFALGDATNLPTSKAGSVTHFEGDTLVANIAHHLAGEPLEPSFDGHSNCFIETGFHKALLIDFNYDVEPLPGRFPEPHLGPLALLKESRMNHMAKLAFQWMYWHVLLPGRDLPGISPQLQLAGKDLSQLPTLQGGPR